MHGVCLCQLSLDVWFTFVHSYDEKDHDTMDQKVSCDNHYVWVKRSIDDQVSKHCILRWTGRHLRQKVEDILEEVKEWPKSYRPCQLHTDIEPIFHFPNFVDGMDIDQKERPIDSVKRGLVYPNEQIHRYIRLQVWQDWKVPRIVILPEKQAYADITLVDRH